MKKYNLGITSKKWHLFEGTTNNASLCNVKSRNFNWAYIQYENVNWALYLPLKEPTREIISEDILCKNCLNKLK